MDSPIGKLEVPFRDGTIALCLTTSAILRLEAADVANRGFNQILAEDFSNEGHGPTMTAFARLFQALMWKDEPSATLEDAAELIDGLLGKHEEILQNAILAAFPDAKGERSGEA